MRQRCANCDRPLLDSDVQCFHCGTPVPGREQEIEPEEGSTADLAGARRLGCLVLVLLVVGALLASWMGAGIGIDSDPISTPAAQFGWTTPLPLLSMITDSALGSNCIAHSACHPPITPI